MFNSGGKRNHPYQSANRFPKQSRVTSFDRHCIGCGAIIKGQAHEKPVVCFRSNCGVQQPYRSGWNNDGWGRCPQCDFFMREEHSYCQCGWANVATIEKKNRLQLAAAQKKEYERQQETKKLHEQLRQQQQLLMMKQREVDDLRGDIVISNVVLPGIANMNVCKSSDQNAQEKQVAGGSSGQQNGDLETPGLKEVAMADGEKMVVDTMHA